ncbi:MAG: hypothetical protein AAF560_18240 [Acidobacteriota bacterium]
MEYLAFIHDNTDTTPSAQEWQAFIAEASASGLFLGGSELGRRFPLGAKAVHDSTDVIAGFMKFEADEPQELLELLQSHPVIRHDGTIELREMPLSS